MAFLNLNFDSSSGNKIETLGPFNPVGNNVRLRFTDFNPFASVKLRFELNGFTSKVTIKDREIEFSGAFSVGEDVYIECVHLDLSVHDKPSIVTGIIEDII